MAYSKTNWTNTSDTPLNAQNLNKMDIGIYDNEKSLNNALHLMTYPNVSADCLTGNFSVTGDTTLTIENSCLNIDSNGNVTNLIGNLSETKTVDNDRLMLIKLRIKRNNNSFLYIAFKYITEDDEVYVINENIIASNLRISGNATPSYLIEDDEYHNIWCVFHSTNQIHIKSIAVELATAVKTTISNFQVFYSMDKAEGAVGEQLVSLVYGVLAESQSEEVTAASVT